MKALLAKLKRQQTASAGAPAAAKAKPVKTGKPVVEYLPDADEIERSPVPWVAQLTVWLVFIGIAGLMAWATFARLDQVVSATGTLVNPVPNVVVQPLETSIIQSVDVRSGQTVKKGDLLATLDATFAVADENQLRSRLTSLETQAASLQAELERGAKPSTARESAGKVPTEASGVPDTPDQRLQAELQAERRANYQAQQTRLAEAVGRLRAALATNRQDQQAIAARLRSVRELEALQEKSVAQKFGSTVQLLEAQQRTKEVDRDLELVRSRERELLRELAAAEAEKQAFERGWRQKTMEDLLAITRERDGLKEQLEKASKRQTLVRLTAPVDGVVLDIAKLSPGSVVRGAETFFTLVPLDVVLEAEAQIAASDIGYVKPGDEVRLKVDTFPFQRHGMLTAKVRSISQDAHKGDARQPVKGNGSYYLAKLVLVNRELDNMKPEARLLPGMSLTAEVVVGDRSVLSYLVWPLTKGIHEAIREPG
jgi:hemolysin D